MNKTTTCNTSTKKSLLAGLLDETRSASQRSGNASAVRAQAGGVIGSVATSANESTGTDPVPVRSFLIDALEKALAAANASKSGSSTAQTKAGGFSGATTGQTTTAGTSQQTQNRLKDAVDAAIAQVNAMKATNDSYVDEQTVRPTAEQKRQAALVARLPDDFPVDEWESLPAKAQLKKMQNTRLSKTEQWDLLNTKTSMSMLRDIGEQTASQSAMLQAAVDRIVNGEETDLSKSTPLQQRAVDGQLKKWKNAMQAAVEKNATPETTPLPTPGAVPVITPVPYPQNGEIAYIFYTDSPEAEFHEQAEYQKEVLKRQGYQVELVCVDNVTTFSDEWNNMDPKTGAAVIISHCNGMSLIFEHNSPTNAISATGLAKDDKTVLPAISDLEGPELAVLYLYACNAAHEELLEQEGTNVADAFRDLANVDTVYAYDGSVGFGFPSLAGYVLEPRLALDQTGYFSVYRNFDLDYDFGLPSGIQRYDSDD